MAATLLLTHFDRRSISNADIYMHTHERTYEIVHCFPYTPACQLIVDFFLASSVFGTLPFHPTGTQTDSTWVTLVLER